MGLDRPIDITTDQRKTVLLLLACHLPNTTAWVYGSRVKWTARPESDLDLVVFAAPEQSGRVSNLREAFEESDLPFRVDLFVWDEVPEQFRKQNEAEHVVLVEREERETARDWQETTLGGLLSFANGKSSPRRSDGLSHPVYGSNGIIGFSDETNADPNTIIVGRVGTYCGSLHYSKRVCWVTDNAIRSTAINGNDAKFLLYLLQTIRLNEWRTGSGQPLLNQTILSAIPVAVPEPEEQCAIAHILGTLDDKIELNRRMNETLEAMARALFRSWFVDFDPVRAKMEGRDIGLPKEIADLFPDRLVDSELGEIPEGWESTRFDHVATITKGRSYRRRELVPSDTALVTLKSFARGGGYRPDGLKSFSGVYKNEQVVEPGEVVVACTDVTQAAEVVGRSAIVGKASSFRTLVASLDVLIVRPTTVVPGRGFVYYLTGTEGFVAHALARTTGTTVLHLSKDAVASCRFVLPPRLLMERFEHCADSLRARIQVNTSAVGLLADLRDTLLPKLVSGEVRVHVSDTQRPTGTAVEGTE